MGIFVATMITAAAMIILWRYDSARMLSPFLQFATAASPDAISVTQRILSDTGLAGNWRGNFCAALACLPGARQFGHDRSVNRLGIRDRAGLADDPVHDRSDGRAFRHALSRRPGARTGFVLSGRRCGLARSSFSVRPSAMQACCIAASTCVACAVIGLGLAQSVSQRDELAALRSRPHVQPADQTLRAAERSPIVRIFGRLDPDPLVRRPRPRPDLGRHIVEHEIARLKSAPPAPDGVRPRR